MKKRKISMAEVAMTQECTFIQPIDISEQLLWKSCITLNERRTKMYKKNFVKKTLNGFQATPIYFFIDIETISILGQDFGERLKDAFEERDALMVWLYMKKMFLHTAHIFCNGEFILIAKRLNEFVDPYDFYETLSKLMSDAEKFEEFLKAIAAK